MWVAKFCTSMMSPLNSVRSANSDVSGVHSVDRSPDGKVVSLDLVRGNSVEVERNQVGRHGRFSRVSAAVVLLTDCRAAQCNVSPDGPGRAAS